MVDRNATCDLIARARRRQLAAEQEQDPDAWVEATEDVDRLLDRLLEPARVDSGTAPLLA